MSDILLDNYNGVKFRTQPTDFIAGVNTPLGVKELKPDGEWDSYRTEHEIQNKGYETSACTVFSDLDLFETLFTFYIKNGMMPEAHLLWLTNNGYFSNGFINFSDRYTAQFAEINPLSGTYQYKAGDAVRRGLIPEAMFPYDVNNYYDTGQITTKMTTLADEFKELFTLNWYWVEDMTSGLKASPLQGIVKYADGEGILRPVGRLNHAIMVYGETDTYVKIDDSYRDRDKKYGKDFVFSLVGGTLTINDNNMNVELFLKNNDLKFVRNSNTGAFGRIMQKKLRVVSTTDRAALLLLDDAHRKNGVTITDSEWKQLPQTNF